MSGRNREGRRRSIPAALAGLVRFAALPLAVLLTAPLHATDDDLRSVAGMRSHNRVLIVFSPSMADARLASQRSIMAQLAVGAATRDLLFVQVDPMVVIGARDNGDMLRRRFRVPVDNYHAILIDKDGSVLREAPGPMDGAAILQAIDHATPAPAGTSTAPGSH